MWRKSPVFRSSRLTQTTKNMNSETSIVAAIDLGSSKIVGILGTVSSPNQTEVLGLEKENSSFAIRRGCVHNIEESIQKIDQIISRLESRIVLDLKKIDRLYIGLGGQSVHSIRQTVSRSYGSMEMLTETHLAEIEYEVRQTPFDKYEVFDLIPVEYRIDGVLEPKPLGAICNKLEVTYTVIIGKGAIKHNIERCMKRMNMGVAGYYVSARALGNLLLTEEERQLGCALIDFGAATTTMVCYKRGVLQHMVTIPFGGNNITKDIMSLNMLEPQAESAKRHHARSFAPEGHENDIIYIKSALGNDGLNISQQELDRITEARIEEILDNLLAQIKEAGLKDQLPCGVIITGGGSQLNGLSDSIQKKFHLQIRRAGIINKLINKTAEPVSESIYHTALALLAMGKESCVEKIPEPEHEHEEAPKPIDQKHKEPNTRKNKNDKKESGRLGSFIEMLFKDNDKPLQ